MDTPELPRTEERRAAGRALRQRVPRSAHAAFKPAPGRPDPIATLEASNRGRIPSLIPVRFGRMLPSPFAFLRGAAPIMADDLAATPASGVRVQACGDAHVANFGVFATPERNLWFDVNDFDETLPAPFEWDVKRLATSVVVVGRQQGVDEATCRRITEGSVAAYRARLATLARQAPLDVWYDRIDVDEVVAMARGHEAELLQRDVAKARHRTNLASLPKFTEVRDGTRRIVDDPPLIIHQPGEAGEAERMLAAYEASLAPDLRPLLERYRIVDSARKVVGVGSVGTRCYLALLMDADLEGPLFLQVKEAAESVLAAYAGPSTYAHQGQRVVIGQRLMQAASDLFLGWTTDGDHHFYVRQLRDMKGSVDLDTIAGGELERYAAICGRALARAHAKAGDAATISGYLGSGTNFDNAVARFALAYADQTEHDHAELVAAVKTGRIPADPDA
jgi:uncharacterized protein (DUF2252 family)